MYTNGGELKSKDRYVQELMHKLSDKQIDGLYVLLHQFKELIDEIDLNELEMIGQGKYVESASEKYEPLLAQMEAVLEKEAAKAPEARELLQSVPIPELIAIVLEEHTRIKNSQRVDESEDVELPF